MVRGLLIGVAVALALWLLAIGVPLCPRSQVAGCSLGRENHPARLGFGLHWGWLISPIDLIPEFLPVVGPLDDAIVAALVLRYVLRRTDRAVLIEHWRADPSILDAILGSPRRKRARQRAAPERERDETHGGSIWRSGKGGSHIG